MSSSRRKPRRADAAPSPPAPTGCKILLIEDDDWGARLMARLLEAAGCRVARAADGQTGLHMAVEHHPDLILVDLGLPDVDGQTVIARLRQLEPLKDIPLVAVTAWPTETARPMALAYGCSGYISKPINTRKFAQQVTTHLQGPNVKQQTGPCPTAP
jgi:two-component system cell cycle response regulator DivK